MGGQSKVWVHSCFFSEHGADQRALLITIICPSPSNHQMINKAFKMPNGYHLPSSSSASSLDQVDSKRQHDTIAMLTEHLCYTPALAFQPNHLPLGSSEGSEGWLTGVGCPPQGAAAAAADGRVAEEAEGSAAAPSGSRMPSFAFTMRQCNR